MLAKIVAVIAAALMLSGSAIYVVSGEGLALLGAGALLGLAAVVAKSGEKQSPRRE